MSMVASIREMLRSLLRRGEEEREMEEELEFHVEQEIEENVRRGMSPSEARVAARRAFGGADRFREETRDARGTRALDDFGRDVGFGLRMLRRSAGPSLIAVLTMALGIGAATAVFSVVKGVLLDPLPYPESDRLVGVWSRFLPESGFDFPRFSLSPPEYFDYRADNESLTDVASMATGFVTVMTADGEPERVRGTAVTSNLFSVLGVPAAAGRVFVAEEDVPNGPRVAMLGHGLWQRAFGGDPGVIGSSIRLNGIATEVVGVMPEGFSYPGPDMALWMTLGLDPAQRDNRQSHFIAAIGRLKPGTTLESASAEMDAMMARWKVEYPDIHTGHFMYLTDLKSDVVGDVRRTLLVLLGSVGLVMLIVCANVASIHLARATARRREVAVRSALGGTRRRLAQQFLTEAGVLAVAGGLLGVVLARVGVTAIIASAGSAIPRASGIDIDGGVALFAVAVTFMSALLAGTLPALRAASASPGASLRDGDRTSTTGAGRARFRAGLVIGEVALAVMVVVAAGLMIRSYRAIVAIDPGFDPAGVLVADVALPAGGYPDSTSILAFHDRLLERARALPGVTGASFASTLPFRSGTGVNDFDIEGRPERAPGEPETSGDIHTITAGYLDVMRIPVVQGRTLGAADVAGAPLVTVVNATAARMFWGEASPIGQRIRLAGESGAGQWLTIVGVIGDVKYASLQDDFRPAWYVPYAQAQQALGYTPRGVTYVLRAAGEPARLGSGLRSVMRELDPSLPIIGLGTMENVVHRSVAQPRFTLRLLGLFASLALVLGVIGLYGTLSNNVLERSREVGIRRALGAQTGDILTRIVLQGIRLTTAGLALGVGASLASSSVMRGLLFGVSPTDPVTLGGVALTMMLAAIAATLVPAIRAVRLDPLRVLRE